MKKIIFFDIDGTLIDSHGGVTEMSEKVRLALKDLQNKGHYIFIATGRPYSFLTKEILEFGFDGLILSSGAHVIIDGKDIYNSPINKNFVKKAVKMLEEKDIQHVLVGNEYSYIKDEYKELLDFYKNINILEDSFKKEFNLDEVETYKIEIFSKNKDVADHCIEFLEKNPEYSYYNSISYSHLEIYFKENTKATGIYKTLDYLNLSIENTYAFGDGTNDVEMLEAVFCGIAMGNASDAVKSNANVITDTVSNDGVEKGIEEYILKER